MHRTDGQSNTSAKKLPPRNFRFSSGDAFIIGAIVLCCAIIIGGLFIHRKIHKGDARYVRITQDGKVLLESKCRISTSPNGNGGWFSSMIRAGFGDILKKEGIEWLNVFSVDNVLQRICDPSGP